MHPTKEYTPQSTGSKVLTPVCGAYSIRALMTTRHVLKLSLHKESKEMETSLIELLLNDVPQALCDVQESKARVSFYALPSGEVRMIVGNTISNEHTRRSQTLQDALPEENVRYMIQQCLQKQPNKKWQAIRIDMYVGEEHLSDIVLIHHFYSKNPRSKSLQLMTESLRLNMLPPPTSQSLKMQDVLQVVDSNFRKIFSALNYSYVTHNMTTVSSKEIKRLQKYLASSASTLRPSGLLTMRELADDVFDGPPTLTSVSMSLLFALLATVLMNVIDAYETIDDVEQRLLRTLETKPEIYILMVSDMKGRLASKMVSPTSTTSSKSDVSVIDKYMQFPDDPTPTLQPLPIDNFPPPDEPLPASRSISADSFPVPDEPLSASEPTPDSDDVADILPVVDSTLPDDNTIFQLRIRDPITGRCLHVGGKSFQRALNEYGIEQLRKWSVC